MLGEYGLFGMPPLNITAYLICNLVFLAFSVGFCGVTMLNGLKALVKLRANADTGVAVAGIVGVVQGVISLFVQGPFQHGQLHLYSVIVCGALFLNTLGKLLLVRRVNKNFHYVTSPDKNIQLINLMTITPLCRWQRALHSTRRKLPISGKRIFEKLPALVLQRRPQRPQQPIFGASAVLRQPRAVLSHAVVYSAA